MSILDLFILTLLSRWADLRKVSGLPVMGVATLYLMLWSGNVEDFAGSHIDRNVRK